VRARLWNICFMDNLEMAKQVLSMSRRRYGWSITLYNVVYCLNFRSNLEAIAYLNKYIDKNPLQQINIKWCLYCSVKDYERVQFVPLIICYLNHWIPWCFHGRAKEALNGH
jgi:hypothetical protein